MKFCHFWWKQFLELFFFLQINMDDPSFIALMKEFYTVQVPESSKNHPNHDRGIFESITNIIRRSESHTTITNIFHKKIIFSASGSSWSSPEPVHWKYQGCEKPWLPQGENIVPTPFPSLLPMKWAGNFDPFISCYLNLSRALGSPTLWTLQRETRRQMSPLMSINWRPMVLTPFLWPFWTRDNVDLLITMMKGSLKVGLLIMNNFVDFNDAILLW